MRRILLIAVLAGLFGFAAVADDAARSVTGEAAYRERIALPADAYLAAETRGADGAFFASARTRADGRQVPLAFSVAAPSGAPATLRVAVEVDGATRWRSEAMRIPAGSGPYQTGALTIVSAAEPLGSFRYGCGDIEAVMMFEGDELTLKTGGERFDLTRARSGSGARYEAPGASETSVWLKGDSAMISLKGETLPECAESHEKPDFRAGGFEPGWNMAITGDRIALTTDYGAERREAILPAPATEADATVYRVAALGASIRIGNAICRDGATGTPHPKTVAVETPKRRLAGCGGAPLDLLTGGEWVAEDIGGGGVIDNSRATIAFGADGRVSGRATCNRFTADFTLTAEALSFGRPAMTKMACPEALMAQERRFAAALERTAGFDFDRTGALILKSVEGDVLLRARRD